MAKNELGEIFPNWPGSAPQTLTSLIDADPELLKELDNEAVWQLRAQAIELTNSASSHRISGPWDALELINSGYVLHPWKGKWRSYLLVEGVPQLVMENGKTRYRCETTSILPKPTELKGHGKWLVLYGGGPEILEKSGVLRGLQKLKSSTSLADILLFEQNEHSGNILWSSRAKAGMSDRNVPAKTNNLLEQIW